MSILQEHCQRRISMPVILLMDINNRWLEKWGRRVGRVLVSYRDRKTLEGGCGSLSVEVRVALTSPSYTSTPLTPLGSHYGQLAGYKKNKKTMPICLWAKEGYKVDACMCLFARVRKGEQEKQSKCKKRRRVCHRLSLLGQMVGRRTAVVDLLDVCSAHTYVPLPHAYVSVHVASRLSDIVAFLFFFSG